MGAKKTGKELMYELISIVSEYDVELVDAMDFNIVDEDSLSLILKIGFENRDRLMDLMTIIMRNDLENEGKFLDQTRMLLNTSENKLSFFNLR